MEIAGTAAIVTGGSSGLGAATARLLRDRGARVVVLDVADPEEPEPDVEYRRGDVADETDVVTAVERAAGLAPLRILVNCAGIVRPRRIIGRDGSYDSALPLAEFTRVLSVNLTGTVNCIRLAATAMSRTEPLADGQRGAIVNTSSVSAFDGQVGQVGYAATKAAIAGMTLPLARDLAPAGIRVNTIAPGMIDTPIYDNVDDPAAYKEQQSGEVLFPRRFGTADEFARLVLELVANDYLNAEVIRLDGGVRLAPRQTIPRP